MNLQEHEIKSPLWAKLKEHCQNELTILRERNDGPLSDIETARLRGRIAQIRAFLELETQPDKGLDE